MYENVLAKADTNQCWRGANLLMGRRNNVDKCQKMNREENSLFYIFAIVIRILHYLCTYMKLCIVIKSHYFAFI